VVLKWQQSGEERIGSGTGWDNTHSALQERTEALSNQRGGKGKCMPNPGHKDSGCLHVTCSRLSSWPA